MGIKFQHARMQINLVKHPILDVSPIVFLLWLRNKCFAKDYFKCMYVYKTLEDKESSDQLDKKIYLRAFKK